jgi:hypothetical protein
MKSGIYGIGASAVQLYAPDSELQSVAYGDFDGDGLTDAVATAGDDTVRVLYRRPGATPSFLLVRLPTEAPPTHLVVANFDGNRTDDIAYVEARGSGEALMIAYGTSDRPIPATDVAELDQVTALVPVALADSVDPDSVVSDLAVVDNRLDPVDQMRKPMLAVFHGSPDRTMTPFVDPRGGGPTSSFQAVAGGRFAGDSSAFDLTMFEVPDSGTTMPAKLWRLAGAGTGALFAYVSLFSSKSGYAKLQPATVPQIGSCVPPFVAMFCTDGSDRSRLVTWPGTDSDQIVGIDPTNAQAIVMDPAPLDFSGASSLTLQPAPIAGLPAMSTLRAVFVADVDGDGVNELVIAFEASNGPGVLACTVTSTVSCRDLIAQVPSLASHACSDAVPGRIAKLGQAPTQTPAKSADLIVQCGLDVFRLFHDDRGYEATPLVTLPSTDTIAGIAVGDVTGDAVDDLLVHVIDSAGMDRLRVYPQLTSREAP